MEKRITKYFLYIIFVTYALLTACETVPPNEYAQARARPEEVKHGRSRITQESLEGEWRSEAGDIYIFRGGIFQSSSLNEGRFGSYEINPVLSSYLIVFYRNRNIEGAALFPDQQFYFEDDRNPVSTHLASFFAILSEDGNELTLGNNKLIRSDVQATSQNHSVSYIPDIPVTSHELFEYTINGEGQNRYITITKFTGSDNAVSIPATINDIPVLVIGSQAFESKIIHTFIVPVGVIAIGNWAVELSPDSASLITIVLPGSVKTVGIMAIRTSIESGLEMVLSGVAPFTTRIVIGSNVNMAPDLYPELDNTPTFPLTFDSFYVRNGKKAGVYTMWRNTANWLYSAD